MSKLIWKHVADEKKKEKESEFTVDFQLGSLVSKITENVTSLVSSITKNDEEEFFLK